MFLDGDGESRLGTSHTCVCALVCVCACTTNKTSRVSSRPYRSATHPQIMCVLPAYFSISLCVCECVFALTMYDLTRKHLCVLTLKVAGCSPFRLIQEETLC